MRASPLLLAPGAELRINGQLQKVRSVSPEGIVALECPLRRTTVTFAMPELAGMHMAGMLEPVHAVPITHKVTGAPKRAALPPALSERVARRISYGMAATRAYPVGPKSNRMRKLIDEVAARIGDTEPPSPHSVYRWVHRYVTSGYDTAVFMQDACVTRTRRRRKLTEDIEASLREHIQVLLGANVGANLNGITNLALARTAKDMGYVKFTTKEGSEELVDHFIATEDSRLEVRRSRRISRAAYPQPPQ